MTQHFPNGQQIKTRKAVLILMKHSAPPLVLYVDEPEELYEELKTAIKTANNAMPKMIEKQAKGPVKNFCVLDTQLAGVAIQEENYL
ncbi:MAG: hypothetical protein MJ180_05515 [Candidatus Gastranaerophilales bacterium]|nr:hypothetical protein [Candidatus Gastranaerophilales bacterium]